MSASIASPRRGAARELRLGVAPRCAIIGLMALLSCDRRPEPALAPRLLFDHAEIAAYLDEFPIADYRIAEVAGVGRFYVDDNPATVKRRLLRGRPWEPHVLRELARYLAPGDIALDVGAHIGSMTVPMARLVGAEGTVYAFEPQKKIYRELVHNLELNEVTNAVPLRFALSSKPGIVEMDPIVERDGRVSVGEGGDVVEARTIDSFGFSDVALMKIDVEGHEADVLRGAERTIDALHPVIIIEIWDENRADVIPILEGYGYSLRRISRRLFEFVATHGPES